VLDSISAACRRGKFFAYPDDLDPALDQWRLCAALATQ
jgi:hypothetical protein